MSATLGEGTLGSGSLGFAITRLPVEIANVVDVVRMDVQILKPTFRAEIGAVMGVRSSVDRFALVLTEVVEVV